MYQCSQGGKIYIPLEYNARILRDSTPRFAKQISSKYSEVGARKVQRDLEENHCRHVSRDYIQNLAQQVGEVVENKEEDIQYNLPVEVLDCKVVSLGRDGTTVHIIKEGYRETMNGTISFYSEDGQRLHTIYLAQAPEYGKASFNDRFAKQINKVKSLMKNKDVKYIGLADGAVDNWSFLASHTEISILDYWHACEYVTKAAKAASKSAYERKQWLESAHKKLKQEKGAAESLLKEMKGFRQKKKLSKVAKENLEQAITYFTNHHHQMKYSDYAECNYPIGSGVTEAACKVVVKQRLCQSGMKWKINGAHKTLMIRSLHHTDGRWQQFWRHIDDFGFSQN